MRILTTRHAGVGLVIGALAITGAIALWYAGRCRPSSEVELGRAIVEANIYYLEGRFDEALVPCEKACRLVDTDGFDIRIDVCSAAVLANRPEVLEFLLERDCDCLRLSGHDGPIHFAIRGYDGPSRWWRSVPPGYSLQLLEMLLRYHPEMVELPSRLGMTPLMLACEAGQSDAVRLLLGHGAQIDVRSADGMTAKDYAADAGCSECVGLIAAVEGEG